MEWQIGSRSPLPFHLSWNAIREKIMKAFLICCKTAIVGVVAAMAMGLPVASIADDAPLSNVAEPGVYKVLAENDQFRVVLATWKPGQRDAFHSHPANAAYRLTDCKNKVYLPDGSTARGGEVKAGTVILQKAIASHSFENVSDKECQSLIVELKQ
jgi:beta-alanine degradation protein BauB